MFYFILFKKKVYYRKEEQDNGHLDRVKRRVKEPIQITRYADSENKKMTILAPCHP
jgi:hypothetical protein